MNHYLQGMVSFLNWMERVGRIKANPLNLDISQSSADWWLGMSGGRVPGAWGAVFPICAFSA